MSKPSPTRAVVHAVVGSYRRLTDGQRWTIGLIVVLVVLFVAFGQRQAP
jgi:hypothetical protein